MYSALLLAFLACGDSEKPEATATAPKEAPKKEVKKAEPKKVEPKKEEAKAEVKTEAKAEEPKKEAVAAASNARSGEEVYNSVCMACHQMGGTGLEGVYPPLAGSDWMAKSNEVLSKIVLHGLMGEIEVAGKKYNSVMTPQGSMLNDQEIANVLTYVRSSWGNKGAAVTAEEVKAVRDANPGHGPWNASEL